MKLNPLLYKENDHHNPTELLLEIFKDIRNLSIKQIFKKYETIISPHEISGLLTQEICVECSKQIIMFRINNAQ